MRYVVDASVALKWVLAEPGSDAAEALLDEELIAPPLWLVEAANALWRRANRGEITADEAMERLEHLGDAPVATIASDEDLPMALNIASTLAHPVYDCLYLAMARREGAVVVTADRRFCAIVEASSEHRGLVRLLGA